jgi:hypothetical protein
MMSVSHPPKVARRHFDGRPLAASDLAFIAIVSSQPLARNSVDFVEE